MGGFNEELRTKSFISGYFLKKKTGFHSMEYMQIMFFREID